MDVVVSNYSYDANCANSLVVLIMSFKLMHLIELLLKLLNFIDDNYNSNNFHG